MFIRLFSVCVLIICGCGTNKQPISGGPESKDEAVKGVGKLNRIPLEYEVLLCTPNPLVKEPHFSVVFHNQRAEQTTVSCSIIRSGTPVGTKTLVAVPGNGKLDFIGDTVGALKSGKLDGLIFPGDKLLVSSQFFNSEFEIQFPGKRVAANNKEPADQNNRAIKPPDPIQASLPPSPKINPNKVAQKGFPKNEEEFREFVQSLAVQEFETNDAYKWPPEYREAAKEMIRKHVEELIKNRPPDLPREKPGQAQPPAPAPQNKNLEEQLREAERRQIDPRHGNVRGLDAQGFPEFKPLRPKPEDLVNVRGPALLRAVRDDRAFIEARARYLKLRDKARILNQMGLPLAAGMSPFEIEEWNDFNSPECLTPSGKCIFDPEAAEGFGEGLVAPQIKPEPVDKNANIKQKLVNPKGLPINPMARMAFHRNLEKDVRSGKLSIIMGEGGDPLIIKPGDPDVRLSLAETGWTPPADLMPKRPIGPQK
jgi:hypothetical protein